MRDNKITYRALIFDDDEVIRKILWMFFDNRGYEVFTFPHPKSCDLVDLKACLCPVSHACADLIITDLNMPFMQGLDFIEQQKNKGCKVRNLMLMSGDITEEVRERAEMLGIKVLEKPFTIRELEAWVKAAEKNIPEDRNLYDWNVE